MFLQDVDLAEEPEIYEDLPKDRITELLKEFPIDIFIKSEYDLAKDKEPKIKL